MKPSEIKCRCISSNRPQDWQDVPSKRLDIPRAFRPQYYDSGEEKKYILVDDCMSEYISALWSHGIWTRGCCCGHNGYLGWEKFIIVDSSDHSKAQLLLQAMGYDGCVQSWQLRDDPPQIQTDR